MFFVFLTIITFVYFLDSLYLKTVTIHFLLMVGFSLCWNIVGGLLGQYSFGNALFFGISSYLSMYFLNISPLYFLLSVPFVLIITASIGGGIAYLSFRFKVEHAYFTLLTIVCLECFRILFENMPFFNGMSGLFLKSTNFSQTLSHYFLIILAFYVFCLYCLIDKLYKSEMGLKCICIKDNPLAAESIGVNPVFYPAIMMALSAALIGGLGVLSIFHKQQLFPDQVFSMHESMYMVLPALIGGVGKVKGPIFGSIIILLINESIDHIFEYFDFSFSALKHVIFGLITLFVVYNQQKTNKL
ncbi:MAG: hypothetical protein HEEMFOPI_00122 [Holosporales bacterium]